MVLYGRLEKKRAEWDESGATVGSGSFKIKFLTGEWTMLHKGVPCDAVQGYASGKVAIGWCAKYGMPQTARWSLGWYGEAEATGLAKAWVSRMNHLQSLWLAQEGPCYIYTSDDVSSWQRQPELSTIEERVECCTGEEIQGAFLSAPPPCEEEGITMILVAGAGPCDT